MLVVRQLRYANSGGRRYCHLGVDLTRRTIGVLAQIQQERK